MFKALIIVAVICSIGIILGGAAADTIAHAISNFSLLMR